MLISILVALAFSATLSAEQCSTEARLAGLCSVTNDGSTVEIVATQPGESRPVDVGSAGGDADEESGPAVPAPPPVDDCRPTDPTSCAVTPTAPEDPTIRPTLADVARFAPASVAIVDEPDGVGIVGMPVNFVTSPVVHEQSGTLFSVPIAVRFTPVAVVYVHGDGTQRTATSGGATWATLGLPQFSATDTSHAYASRGTYTAQADVRYAAEYNLGAGWLPIDGLLGVPTAPIDIQILEARTALVDKTCVENPGGPGC